MTEQALCKMIAAGESTRQEFKSWVKCKDYRQRKDLAVKSAVALANTKGGVLLFGVEDDGTITGCPKSDPQALMEAIYDMTRPSLFTEIEPVETSDGVVLVVSVEKSNSHVATTGGIYYRRLGNVTKPDYPANDVYSPADNPDFSAKIVEGATESDIDLLEVYRLKEKLAVLEVWQLLDGSVRIVSHFGRRYRTLLGMTPRLQTEDVIIQAEAVGPGKCFTVQSIPASWKPSTAAATICAVCCASVE